MHLLQIAFTVLAVSSLALASPGGNYWGVTGHGYGGQYAYPNYNFNYGVHSPHTGDVKNHQESRHGDHVRGSYSLNEPDGTIRQVDYVADKHNGFNAVVKKLGHAVHPPTVHHQHHHYGGTAAHFGGGLYGVGAHNNGGFGLYGSGGNSYAFVSKGSGHLGGGLHYGSGFGGATSYANGNNLSFGNYGVGRYASGHYGLGTNSYGLGNSYAINHFGGGNYGGHFGGATSYANGNSFALSHFGGHHF